MSDLPLAPSGSASASFLVGRSLCLPTAFREWFERVWLLVLPIVSVLVIPEVQGSTPGAVCAGIALVAIAVVPTRVGKHFLLWAFLWGVLYAVLQCISAIASKQMPAGLIRYLTFTNEFRVGQSVLPTVITQTAYLVVGVATALYARHFASRRWLPWVYGGALLLLGYGVYEWLYYFIFQESGDFLTNRTFSEEVAFDPDGFTGSMVQAFDALGHSWLRLKSLTNEPSTYALTTLPYFFLALADRKLLIAGALFLGLALSTSSTAVVVLPLGLALWLVVREQGWRLTRQECGALLAVIALGLAALAALALTGIAESMLDDVYAKFSGKNVSGEERLASHQNSVRFFLEAPLMIQLFGLGFGATRPLSFLDWLLVNCGVVGTVVWTAVFTWPIARLQSRDGYSAGLRVALGSILAAMMIAVPEFSYSTIWLFLGLAYAELAAQAHVH